MTTKFYTVKDIPETWANARYEVPIFNYKNPNLLIVTLMPLYQWYYAVTTVGLPRIN